MAQATITPKTDREKAVLALVMQSGQNGVARMDIEDKLKISKPTVEKLIKGLGLKKVRQERRKEFFGIPEGARVEGMENVPASATAGQTQTGGQTGEGAQSGKYRLPRGGQTPSGAFPVGQASNKALSADERATLVKIANALLG
jgi:DNA-binding CsgD family transcriptional regulator